MEALACLVLLLTMFKASDGTWCLCRSDESDSVLQKTLDYACGAGADCNPILQNGPCFQPNTVRAHCSYAANSYYQRKGQAQGACDFAGTATLTSTDPSASGCTYPATPSAAGTTSSSTSTPGSSTTPSSSTFSPPGTVLGGLGPSGNSISTDSSGAGLLPQPTVLLRLLAAAAFLFPAMFFLTSGSGA